jgi:hypothetical protein
MGLWAALLALLVSLLAMAASHLLDHYQETPIKPPLRFSCYLDNSLHGYRSHVLSWGKMIVYTVDLICWLRLMLTSMFCYNLISWNITENFQEACGAIQNSTLPPGFAITTTSTWSPPYLLQWAKWCKFHERVLAVREATWKGSVMCHWLSLIILFNDRDNVD